MGFRNIRYYLLIAGVCHLASAPTLYAQKKLKETKLFKKFISSEPDSGLSSAFMIFPVLGYSQETSLEYGLNGNYSFFADKTDTTVRSSSLNSFITLTANQQINLKAMADIWTSENAYHFIGEARYRHYPFSFYGVGSRTNKHDKDVLIQKLFRFRAEGEKKITNKYYAGLNLIYENYSYTDEDPGGIFDQNSYFGKDGGKYLALGISQSLDSRNSVTYTTDGSFARMKLSYAPDLWGGNNFWGGKVELDLRHFVHINQETTLGINSVYQGIIASEIPFYMLPELGSDEIMRGYYQGRYRDKNMFAVQAELRYRINPRLGAAIFSGAGTVFRSISQINALKPSYGAGLSYFFDLNHNSSVRIDYGFGEKRHGESRQSGLYLSLGQAF